MSNKIFIGWPTITSQDVIDKIGDVEVRVNNQMPTMQQVATMPGFFIDKDAFGADVLCSIFGDSNTDPYITDGNQSEHYAALWVLVPTTGSEYVGGHPHYVPKPPTK